MELRDSKKYNNIKLAVGIGEGILSFILMLLFVATGLSSTLVNILSGFFTNPYIIFLAFVLIKGLTALIIFAPVNFYSGFYLEHKYNFSNQSLLKWLYVIFKEMDVSLVIGIPILVCFFYVLNKFTSLCWLLLV